MDRDTLRNYLISLSQYLPDLVSGWGLITYSIFAYVASYFCLRCLGVYTDRNFDIEKAFKEQIIQ